MKKVIFNVFKKSNIFSSITKIGLKYVDLFEFPIINKIGNEKVAINVLRVGGSIKKVDKKYIKD